MPYSVPRRRGHLATLGSSDSEAPAAQEKTGSPLRLLHSLPTNVIIHSASPSPHKQQKGKSASQPNIPADRMSPSISVFGLPTPPHSHSNDDPTSRRSATPDNTSKRFLRTTPRNKKRSHESPGKYLGALPSASKRRAVQAETPRSVYSGPRPGEESPSKSRTSPVKSLVSDLLRRNLQPNRSDYDDDDTCTKDRIVLLPTKRTRDLDRSRQIESASKTFDTDLPETSRRILFGQELREQQQLEEEEENQQPGPQHEDIYEDSMQMQDQGLPEMDQASTGYEQQDSIPAQPPNASSPSVHVSTPSIKGSSPIKRSELLRSSPRFSSPAIHNATLIDLPLSPSQHRERLSSNQQPMESTPFRLGTKKASGRKSTPHPGQEGRVRASMAALDSPRRARRVPKDEEELLQEQAAAAARQSSSPLPAFSREQSLFSARPAEREMSTILAYEQDGSSGEDDLSQFTVEASRLRMDSTSEASLKYDQDAALHMQAGDYVQDESEEILADDFIYETVVVEEQQQQQSKKQEESEESEDSASSRDSSPVLVDIQYNPEGDMNIDQAEVQRRQQQMKRGDSTQRHLQSRSSESSEEEADDSVEEETEQHFEEDDEDEEDKEVDLEMEGEEDSQEEKSTIEMEDEESEEEDEVVEKVMLEEFSEDDSMEDEESIEESEAEEELQEEDSLDEEVREQRTEESESEEEDVMQDMPKHKSSEEELSAEEEEAEEVIVEPIKGRASERLAPSVGVAEHPSRSLMADRSGNASRDQRLDSVMMDSTINNSLWRSFTDRTRLLTARPGAVEVSSMNRDNAARATAILTLFHKYVQYGVLDVEIDDEEIEASMHHHALAQETAALRQLLSQHGAGDADKTLDEVLAEKESEIKKISREGRLQLPSTPLLISAATAGSPKTPMLPGAFPQSTAKARQKDNELHLSPEKISDKSFRYCPPSEVNLAVFTKQNWRALESVVKAEIAAAARGIVATSRNTQEKARLQAALELDQGHLANAFLDAYKVSPSSQGQAKQWSKEKVQSKVASLIRTYLVSLQREFPDLDIDADAMADATLVKEVATSRKEKERGVDDSGVAEASLRLPFQMVTESTPAPLRKPDAMRNDSLFSPSLDTTSRSDGINIYPRLPNPLPPFSTEWKRSDTSKAPVPAHSQEKRSENSGDVSMGLTGLASKSLGYLYATMGWNKRKEAEAEERPAEVATAPARLPRSTLASSSSYDHSSLSFNRSQSQIHYGTGSSRLIRSGGVSSSVDPTALALLSPHTHQLAKAKVQQFKDSRKANNWRSPRHDRLAAAETSNSSMSRLR